MTPEKKFFMLYVEGRGNPTVQHPYRHHAIQEAERLAAQTTNIGRKVYLLETTATCIIQPGPAEWKQI